MQRLGLATSLVVIGATAVGARLFLEPPGASDSRVYTSATQSVHNAAFYNGGTVDVREPQTADTMSALRSRLGKPGLVVVGPGGSDEVTATRSRTCSPWPTSRMSIAM